MGDVFWDVATSYFALGVDGILLLAAAVVGFFPLVKYLPAIGAYVPAARLVAVLVAGLMCFLVGFRIADEREAGKILRATIAAQRADLETARKSEADANQRASQIEKSADDQRKSDDEYISTLNLAAGCGFEPFPGRVRNGSGAGAGVPRSAADAGTPVQGPAAPVARSAMPFSLVRRLGLQRERP